jgi:hypothetical protein
VTEPAMTPGVVWLPAKAPGAGVGEHLAAVAGDLVTVTLDPAAPPSADLPSTPNQELPQ